MSFNRKSSINYEFDDMKIKSRLNTSLEMEGLSVSEDLINRTLAAIKNQSQTAEYREQSSNPKRIVRWNRYVYGLAGVAAAALIMFIGLNMSEFGMKKDADFSGKSTDNAAGPEMEYATNSVEQEADTGYIADRAAPGQKSIDVNMAADSLEEVSKGNEELFSITATDTIEEATTALNFSEIWQLTAENIENLTITDLTDQSYVILTELEDIQLFYSTMGSYQYTYGSESLNEIFTIEMGVLDSSTLNYEIIIGSTVTVRYLSADMTRDAVYEVIGYEDFIKSFRNLFQKLKP